RQTGNYHWCANETCLETDLTPSALFHQTNLTLPPLDPQSWILLIPIVSHVSECSTIRKGFASSRRDDSGAETSTPGANSMIGMSSVRKMVHSIRHWPSGGLC